MSRSFKMAHDRKKLTVASGRKIWDARRMEKKTTAAKNKRKKSVTPKKMGRPSSRSPKIVDAICLRLSCGETMQKICSDPDMPHYATVWRWEQEDDEFCKLSARAREIGTHYIADDCISIADNPNIDPNDKRIRIDTRLRLIGKWNNKNYGDKVSQEISGKDGAPVPIQFFDNIPKN